MSSKHEVSSAAPAANEILISRRFDAPRELVWRAFTEPAHVEKWWGPRGFTTTNHEHDLRVGGDWRLTMTGPDGTDYPNWSRFIEIDPPARLSFIHGWDDGKEQEMHRSFITLDEDAGGTLVTMRMVFPTVELRNKIAEDYGAVEGGRQTMDKLAEHLAVMRTFPDTGTGEAFVITRVFEAPRALVWKAWTDPEHIGNWWGPPNCLARVISFDLRPGGMFHYIVEMSPKQQIWGRMIYRELDPPRRLSFVMSFSDPEANIVRSPFNGEWPLELLSTLTLDEQDGRTIMSMTATPVDATKEERRTFVEGFPSMTAGWGGSLERLTTLLAERTK